MEFKSKILFVDDEVINLQLFVIKFKRKYEVITAENGLMGLEVLEANTDTLVIISDMKMPGMNGLEFITKAKEKFPDKKFYILTGFEITDEIKAALDSGLIEQYFSKPFDINQLEKVIQDSVNRTTE